MSTQRDDGGPAFGGKRVTFNPARTEVVYPGLSVLDVFAAHILGGMLNDVADRWPPDVMRRRIQRAYQIAAMMLAERATFTSGPFACSPDALASANALNERLLKFAQWAVRESCWEGTSLDGGDVQDKAVELGLIERVPYDPEKHGPAPYVIDEGCDWYVFSALLADMGKGDGG